MWVLLNDLVWQTKKRGKKKKSKTNKTKPTKKNIYWIPKNQQMNKFEHLERFFNEYI
jgi:hypothetical protein